MNLKLYGSALLFGVLTACCAFTQDFSNKGKDFWIGYGNHVRMFNAGGNEQMQLYITSDVNTTGQVTISSIGFNQTFSVTANQITTINIPRSAALMDNGLYNHGIHVTAVQPIVVYSFIYVNAVSGATLCLPTATLGKDYFSVNYTQSSNEANSYSYFFVIATDTGTTSVEITPSADTKGGQAAGIPFTVNLTQGQIYQVLGRNTGFTGVDLTGSRIRSISSGASGCKRIAVFSGSGKISIGCANAGSSDNLYQQMYPTSTWGKKYIVVPGLINSTNFFRIIKSDPSTVVTRDGIVIPAASFTNNFYYQFSTNQPTVIEADKPILVAQYFTTQGCAGNPGFNNPAGSPGSDPEMIFLNPVEQTIDRVTLNSMQPSTGTAITAHYLNVVLKNNAAAINSFRVDGAPYTSFIPVPSDPSYSYARLQVTQGTHNLVCDTGFNVMAYGFGNAESYGYSGGTNLKDLYQFVSIKNEYATVDFPAACKNSPFRFSMTFPYQPLQIQWQFGGLFNDTTVIAPVFDSSWTVNGKQLYRYSLPGFYTMTSIGTFPIKVIAQNPTIDGCRGEQIINYDLKVYDRPIPDFSFTSSGCVSDTVKFLDNSNTNGRASYKWGWLFGDGTASTLQNPSHLYSSAGSFNVKFAVITDIGCLSDTMIKTVVLTDPPVAKFGVSSPNCVNKTILFTDSSAATASTLVKWYWNFGDGTPQVVATSNVAQSHTYSTTGVFNVTLKVESSTGCQSSVFSKSVIVTPNPVPNFNFGNACLPTGTIQFTNTSTIADNSIMNYNWDFGDGTTSTQNAPAHNYTTTGPYDVKLTVTSAAGCTENIIKTVNTIYAQPQATFTAPAEVCLGAPVNFTDQSTAPNSTVTQWNWNFGNGQTSTQQNPSHTYTAAGTYSVTLTVTSAIGCTSTVANKLVTINSLPGAAFTYSSPDCVTKNITFTDASVANSGNIIEWNWNLGDGTTITKNNNQPFTHNFSSTGTYTVTLQVKTDKGCSSTLLSKSLIVHPLPVPGFSMPGNCLTDPFTQFMDTSKIADGTESQFTYVWNFGDPNSTPSNNTSTQKNPQHKYTAVGNYTVSLTVTSVNGCSASISQVFTINGTTPQAAFSFAGGAQQCSNKSITVQNNSTVDFGNIVKLEIFWDYAGDPSNKTVVINPPLGGSYSHTYPEFYTPTTKDYVVRMVAYSGDNCLSSVSQTITMLATPQVTFSPVQSVCADVPPFQITQAGIGSNLPGSGLFSGTGITPAGIFNPQLAGPGTHIIRYTYTGTNGCSNFKEQNITVYPFPTVTAGPDRFMLEGGSTTLLGSGTGINLVYLWSPATSLSNVAISQPVATPVDDITYTLTVTSSDGCKASDMVFVKVLKEPTIPNVFTPNGDGINDKWEIQYIESYPGTTIQVFNRYGQKVFESKGYTKPWDGLYNGAPLPAGTYYYIVDPKNGRKQITGFVDIVR